MNIFSNSLHCYVINGGEGFGQRVVIPILLHLFVMEDKPFALMEPIRSEVKDDLPETRYPVRFEGLSAAEHSQVSQISIPLPTSQ